jgi:small-conductance mechanosensitive channel
VRDPTTSLIVLESRNLLTALIQEAETVTVLWQVAVVAGAYGLAWLAARRLRPILARLASPADPSTHPESLSQPHIVTPLLAWLLLTAARAGFGAAMPVRVLDIAIPLSSSLVIIRIAVYMLRYAVPGASWVRTSERAIAWSMWVGAVLHITGILPRIRTALSEIVLRLGSEDISALDVVEGTLAVVVTMAVVLWLGRVIERRLMRLAHLDTSLRVVVAKLVKAVLLLIGVLTALSLVGIDITVLSVFGGALGVGLGFGLQKIAANYVSGFAILLDRSIKLGDLVTIDNRYGEVTRLTTRYVVVKGQDGTESIIPNETVITSTVLNHSYSDRKLRVDGAIQVGYSTDVRRALEIIGEILSAHPRVEAAPPPLAVVTGFGDSGINIGYFVWIDDPENGTGLLRSEISLALLDAFRENGIEIPFPHRDVRITGTPPGWAPDRGDPC